jgi:hypothetical protein
MNKAKRKNCGNIKLLNAIDKLIFEIENGNYCHVNPTLAGPSLDLFAQT